MVPVEGYYNLGHVLCVRVRKDGPEVQVTHVYGAHYAGNILVGLTGLACMQCICTKMLSHACWGSLPLVASAESCA